MSEHRKIADTPHLPDHPEGWTKDGWNRYVKEHNKKLKRLRRESTGENMERPPEPDYE